METNIPMTDSIKFRLVEHESLTHITRHLPRKETVKLFSSVNVTLTSLDASRDVIVLGASSGSVFLYERRKDKLHKLSSKKSGCAVSFVKIQPSLELVSAVGWANGDLAIYVTPFSKSARVLEVEKTTVYELCGSHKSSITALHWTSNARKLFSGDKDGLVFCFQLEILLTEVSSFQVTHEPSPIIQLSYAHQRLVVSSQTQTIIYNIDLASSIAIGTQERKIKEEFGAVFLPLLCRPQQAQILSSQPGLKFWNVDIWGEVNSTLALPKESEVLFNAATKIQLLHPSPTTRVKEPQVQKILCLTSRRILTWSSWGILILDIIDENDVIIRCHSRELGHVRQIVLVQEDSTKLSSDNFEILVLRDAHDLDTSLLRLSTHALDLKKLITAINQQDRPMTLRSFSNALFPNSFLTAMNISSEPLPTAQQPNDETKQLTPAVVTESTQSKPDQPILSVAPSQSSLILAKTQEDVVQSSIILAKTQEDAMPSTSDSISMENQINNTASMDREESGTFDLLKVKMDAHLQTFKKAVEDFSITETARELFIENNKEVEGVPEASEITEDGVKVNFPTHASDWLENGPSTSLSQLISDVLKPPDSKPDDVTDTDPDLIVIESGDLDSYTQDQMKKTSISSTSSVDSRSKKSDFVHSLMSNFGFSNSKATPPPPVITPLPSKDLAHADGTLPAHIQPIVTPLNSIQSNATPPPNSISPTVIPPNVSPSTSTLSTVPPPNFISPNLVPPSSIPPNITPNSSPPTPTKPSLPLPSTQSVSKTPPSSRPEIPPKPSTLLPIKVSTTPGEKIPPPPKVLPPKPTIKVTTTAPKVSPHIPSPLIIPLGAKELGASRNQSSSSLESLTPTVNTECKPRHIRRVVDIPDKLPFGTKDKRSKLPTALSMSLTQRLSAIQSTDQSQRFHTGYIDSPGTTSTDITDDNDSSDDDCNYLATPANEITTKKSTNENQAHDNFKRDQSPIRVERKKENLSNSPVVTPKVSISVVHDLDNNSGEKLSASDIENTIKPMSHSEIKSRLEPKSKPIPTQRPVSLSFGSDYKLSIRRSSSTDESRRSNTIIGESSSQSLMSPQTALSKLVTTDIYAQKTPVTTKTDEPVVVPSKSVDSKDTRASTITPEMVSSNVKNEDKPSEADKSNKQEDEKSIYGSIQEPVADPLALARVMSQRSLSTSSLTSVQSDSSLPDLLLLTDSLLSSCDLWSYHRAPPDLTSLTACDGSLYATDSKNFLHGAPFKQEDSARSNFQENLVWTAGHKSLSTEFLIVSLNGKSIWRLHKSRISVYTGPLSSASNASLVLPSVHDPPSRRSHSESEVWKEVLRDIRHVDMDATSVCLVTLKGWVKVQTEGGHRERYITTCTTRCPQPALQVSMLNGVIWALVAPPVNHKQEKRCIYCLAIPSNLDHLSTAQWDEVVLPSFIADCCLVASVHLGHDNTAWIVTIDAKVLFTTQVSRDQPQGNGIWSQISLQSICDSPSDQQSDRLMRPLDHFSFLWGKLTTKEPTTPRQSPASSFSAPSLLLTARCSPTPSSSSLWIYSPDRSLISNPRGPLLGHQWLPKVPRGMPDDMAQWSSISAVTIDNKVHIWCVHNPSAEVFCHWSPPFLSRSVSLPFSSGTVISLSAGEQGVWAITYDTTTLKTKLFRRQGIRTSCPLGTSWYRSRDADNLPSRLVHISCGSEYWGIWGVDCRGCIYTRPLTDNVSSKNDSKSPSWKDVTQEERLPSSPFISVFVGPGDKLGPGVWAIDTRNWVFARIPDTDKPNRFCWAYIAGPKASSLSITDTHVWLLEQGTGHLYVRCRITPTTPLGSHWLHIPPPPSPSGLLHMSVARGNRVWGISSSGESLVELNVTTLNTIDPMANKNQKKKETVRRSSSRKKSETGESKSGRSRTKRAHRKSLRDDDWDLLDDI